MRTLRVTVSDSEYDAIQKVADARNRSVEQLIQETLASFQHETAGVQAPLPLRDLPLYPEHRLVADLPSRADLYEEIFSGEGTSPRS
jgi:hypothetical protein